MNNNVRNECRLGDGTSRLRSPEDDWALPRTRDEQDEDDNRVRSECIDRENSYIAWPCDDET